MNRPLPRLSASQVRRSLPNIDIKRGRELFAELERQEERDRLALDSKPATPETNDAG